MKEYKYGNVTVKVHGTPNTEKVKAAVKEFVKAVEKEKGLLGPNPFKDYSFRRLTFLLREEECRTVYQQILQDQRSIFVHGSI